MSVSAPTENRGAGGAGSAAALAVGLTLLTFGAMITLVGGMLSGMCFIGGGILCSGTGIGSIGFTMLSFGVPMLLIGIPLFAKGRRALRAAPRVQIARQLQVATDVVIAEEARSRTECQHCGAPIHPGVAQCEFCGGYTA